MKDPIQEMRRIGAVADAKEALDNLGDEDGFIVITCKATDEATVGRMMVGGISHAGAALLLVDLASRALHKHIAKCCEGDD